MKKILFFILFYLNTFAQNTQIEEYNVELDYLFKEEKAEKIESIIKEPMGDWKRLRNQTMSAGILAAGTAGILFILPEEFTNWNKNDIKTIQGKWLKKVKRGPVWDHDDAILNWVAHPYVGSTYYIAARKSNFNEFNSFLYSFAMSTLFWEYGVEAFAETPSIQDLILTPVMGAFLGEYLFHKEKEILDNDGKIGDSKFLGKTALILIDPIGTLSNILGFKDEHVEGSWTVGQNLVEEEGIVRVEPLVGFTFTYSF